MLLMIRRVRHSLLGGAIIVAWILRTHASHLLRYGCIDASMTERRQSTVNAARTIVNVAAAGAKNMS